MSLDKSKQAAVEALKALGMLSPEQEATIEARVQNQTLAKAKELFKGSSEYATKLRELVVKIAHLPSGSVLIHGESGTGKDVVAKIIASAQGHFKYVPVNCAAIPDTLFESEFFGHLAGAFTGAVRERKGHLETVANGVLFLDEVGEMPKHQQAKLLRVLQDRTFSPVGSSELRQFSARVVAATNKPMDRAGDYVRLDFYERVSTYELRLEPLRNNPTDLVDITSEEFFNFAMQYKSASPTFLSGNARQALRLFERWKNLGPSYLTPEDFS